MEEKEKKSKETLTDTSKDELVFTESKNPPCGTCKEPKEVEIKPQLYTREEMEQAMTIVDKRYISPEQMKWLINLNNRVLGDKKQYGCGKCHVQVLKNLKNAYIRLYS